MSHEIITNSEQITNFLNPHYLKPWQNEKVAASWACEGSSVGPGQTDAQVFSQVHASRKKSILWSPFRKPRWYILYFTTNIQLALSYFGCPNRDNPASTSMQMWSRPMWAQVIAAVNVSARKAWLFEVASRPKSVFNLLQLANQFGQDFKISPFNN